MATWRGIHGISDPPLFMKFSVSKSGYSVHLTDLSRVWAEDMSRRDVIRRAVIDGCSIDPTEGDDQYSILLEKINDGLSQAPQTQLSICKGDKDGQLLIRLTAELPRPFPPLHWDVRLSFQTGHSVADELVMPLLKQTSQLRRQIKQLVHEIAIKDNVVFKITDRLENSGQDLSLVFPNVSNLKISRKKSQREQFSPHVKGLAEFDFGTWKASWKTNDAGNLDAETMNDVFQELPPAEDDHANNTWWLKLPAIGEETPIVPDSLQPDGTPKESKSGDAKASDSCPSSVDAETSAQDDFQKQSTPPHLRSRHREATEILPESGKDGVDVRDSPGQAQVDLDEETATEDEDDDLDGAPPNKKPRRDDQEFEESNVQVPDRSKSNSATIDDHVNGRALNDSNAADIPSQHQIENPAKVPTSSTPDDSAPLAQDGENNVPLPSIAKPKSKLGTLGGKSKTASSTPQNGEPMKQRDAHDPSTKRLGTLGGDKQAHTREKSASSSQAPRSQPSDTSRGRSKSPQHGEGQQKQKETSQERANRKREELRREMESKAKAPAKKKRKF